MIDIIDLIKLAYSIDLFKLRQAYGMEQTDNIGSLYNRWNAVKVSFVSDDLTSTQLREIQRQIPYGGHVYQDLGIMIRNLQSLEENKRVERMFAERNK